MSQTSSDDCIKKFQLTDSYLRRYLSQAEYEHIQVIEPTIVTSDSSKKLKGFNYKHTVLSGKCLYVVNTSAKSSTDLLLALPLYAVTNVAMVYDIPNFLQGDLKEQAQHIEITSKFSKEAAYDDIVTKSDDFSSRNSIPPSSLPLFSQSRSTSQSNVSSRLNSSQEFLLPYRTSKIDNCSSQKSKFNGKEDFNESNSSSVKKKGRPLPKPVVGTEMLNASYTNALSLSSSKRCMSPSRSMDCLTTDRETNKFLNCSLPSKTLLSKSWNDILKLQQSEISEQSSPTYLKERHGSLNESTNTISPNQSLSSKLFKLFKGSNENVDSASRSSSFSDSEAAGQHRLLKDVEQQHQSLICDDKEVTFQVDVFTLTRNSKFFNALREAWIYALIKSTAEYDKDMVESKLLSQSSSRKSTNRKGSFDMDVMTNKFAQLKEEILQCKNNEQLFLLTKEIAFACQHYISIRKMAWKSNDLMKYYITQMKILHQSKEHDISDQLDNLDLLILVGELFINIFQGSAMFNSRNTFINENSAIFIKDMTLLLLKPLPISKYATREQEQEDELDELLQGWMDTATSLLFEVISCASQFKWCCNIESKSFGNSVLLDMLNHYEKYFLKLMEATMRKIIHLLSTEDYFHLSCEGYVLFYKQLELMRFVSAFFPRIMQHIKTYFQEEIKYYIRKVNPDNLPKKYPLSPLLEKSLINFITNLQ